MTPRSRQAGITLIELMTVMVIVAILSAIAIPGYRNYVMRANRAEAKAEIMAMAGALERCFTRFNSYEDDAGCTVDVDGFLSPEGHYLLSAEVETTTFVITATPQGAQASDKCGAFTLDSTNEKNTAGGSEPPATCWAR